MDTINAAISPKVNNDKFIFKLFSILNGSELNQEKLPGKSGAFIVARSVAFKFSF